MGETGGNVYDRLWPPRLDLLKKIIAAGESERARAISLLEKGIADSIGSQQPFVDGNRVAMPMTSYGKRAADFIGLLEDVVLSPFFLRGSLPAAWICGLLEQEKYDHICELGAGWGRNIFDLHDLGIDHKIALYAADLSPAGVEMIDRLAALAPAMSLNTFQVDFRDIHPLTWPIPRDGGRALFFTNHAIEQVPEIGAEFFLRLIEAYPHADVIHFEPFGHQIPEDQDRFRMQRQGEFFDQMKWNSDLYETLLGLNLRGRIRIHSLLKNFYGKDPQNLCSIIRWSPA